MKVFLLVIILVSGTLSITPDESSLPIHRLSEAGFRVKKNNVNSEYLEQCGIVDAWREQPGFVNVLAFLDPYWQFSHRQAIMLKLLKDRLERSGVTDVRFFVVISAHPQVGADNADSADEKEAWAGAAPNEALGFSEIEQSVKALRNETHSDIPLVQDTEKLRLWERLQASRDQIFVIDRCGRLSYQVIVPWSILHYPYVKAAILSTYKDQPCGKCDLQPVTEPTAVVNSETERLPETLSHISNVTRMKEIAMEKYNLDRQFEKVKKPQHHKQFEDLPDNILKLLNEKIGMKHDNIQSEHNDSGIQEATAVVEETIEQHNSSNQNDTPQQVNTSSRETPALAEMQNTDSDEDTLNSMENQLPDIIKISKNNSSYLELQHYDKDGYNNNNKSDQEQTNTRMLSNEDNKLEENDGSNTFNRFVVNPEDSLEMYEYLQNRNKEDLSMPRKDRNDSVYADETSLSIETPKNEIVKTGEDSDKNAWSSNSDYLTPIRIIMHAPHVHESGYSTRKHEYLVLRIGQPNYHDHLDSGEKVTRTADISTSSETNDQHRQSDNEEDGEADTTALDIRDKNETNEHFNRTDDEKESNSDYAAYHGNKFGFQIYGKDESPGFYGEDSDYWRNYGNEEHHETLENTQPNADEHYIKINKSGKQTEYNVERFYGDKGNSSSDSVETDDHGRVMSLGVGTESMIERTEYEKIAKMEGTIVKSAEESIQGKNLEVTVQSADDPTEEEEEEIRNKLITHYSKLLPWISYVLEK